MAWTVDAIGTPATGSDGSGNVLVPAVSGIVAGQNLFICAASRPESGVAGSYSTPSGWSLVATMSPDASSIGGAIFHKVAAGGEGTTTVAASTGAVTNGGFMFRCSGGPATGLTALTSAQAFSLSQTDISTPGLTIAQPNCLVIIFAIRNNNQDSAGVNSWPGGATTRVAFGSSIGFNELGLVMGTIIQTTATNIASGTIDTVSNVTLANNVILVAIQPAGAATVISDSGANRGVNRGINRGRT